VSVTLFDDILFPFIEFVQCLMDRQAVFEHGRSLVLETSGLDFTLDDVDLLRRHGIVVVGEDEFHSMTVAVRASQIDLQWRLFCTQPQNILALPASDGSHKLDLMLQLVREGWTAKFEAVMDPLEFDGPQEFSVMMLGRAISYFSAILQHDAVFKKGCTCIQHGRPQTYYDCLLAFDRLDEFHDDPARLTWGYREFAILLKGGAVESVQLIEGLALADIDHDMLDDGVIVEHGGDLLMADLPPVPIADVVGPVLAGFDLIDDAVRPVTVQVGDTSFTIRFDYWSHASHIQRGYTQCAVHRACFRYSQTTQFADRPSLVAYLAAWAEMGPDLNRLDHQSRALVVPQARQDAIRILL
jgi:hypothetical protein